MLLAFLAAITAGSILLILHAFHPDFAAEFGFDEPAKIAFHGAQ